MNAVELKGIGLEAGHFRLQNVSVSFPQGKITAIVGPNGSGKSTLLRIITRLQQADCGNVLLAGRDARSYSAADFAKTATMLTQSKGQLPDFTVRELVAYGRSPYKRLFDRMTAADRDIVDWALDVTDTRKHEQRMFHTLSGGEQQKARIAMALAQKTGLLLLDEPTTYLDLSHQWEVMELLQQLNRRFGLTIVMVLHDLQQAAACCHHMIAVQHGRIVEAGEPKRLLTARFLQEVFRLEAKVKFEDGFPVIIPVHSQTNQGGNETW